MTVVTTILLVILAAEVLAVFVGLAQLGFRALRQGAKNRSCLQ